MAATYVNKIRMYLLSSIILLNSLSVLQGLSLVIEDNSQGSEIYTEACQEADSTEHGLTNSTLVETDVFTDPLLEREEGELIEIKGEEPLIVGGGTNEIKVEGILSDGEKFICKVSYFV